MHGFDLSRFETAQHGVYADALLEIRAGRKQTHWMWFIFPQVGGLGLSETSVYFAITSLEEANAYLAHPVLGCRLREITDAILAQVPKDAVAMLGITDAKKFQSSMTLFASIAPHERRFSSSIDAFFDCTHDQETLCCLEVWRRA